MNKVVFCLLIITIAAIVLLIIYFWVKLVSAQKINKRLFNFNNTYEQLGHSCRIGPVCIDYSKKIVIIENVIFKPGHFLKMEIKNQEYYSSIFSKGIRPVLKISIYSKTHPEYSIYFKYWQDAEKFLSIFEQEIVKLRKR